MLFHRLLLLSLALVTLGTAASSQVKAPLVPLLLVRVDWQGDPLPPDAVARCGSGRWLHTAYQYFLAFSPDGKVVVLCSPQSVILWDTATGKRHCRIVIETNPMPDSRNHHCCHAAFAPDGRTVTCVCLSADNLAESVVVDVAQGKVLQRTWVEEKTSRFRAVAVRPDGNQIALSRQDFIVTLHDPGTGQETLSFQAEGKRLDHIAYTPDGKQLAVCAWDDTVRLYDVTSGMVQDKLQVRGAQFTRCLFSPNGQRLGALSEPLNINLYTWRKKTFQVWDWSTRKVLFQIAHPDKTEVREKPLPPPPPDSLGNWFTCAAFSPDGRFLLHEEETLHQFTLRDATNGKIVKPLQLPDFPQQCVYAPDGKTLLSGNWGRLSLWDTTRWEKLPCSREESETVFQSEFSRDGRRLLGMGTAAWTWDVKTGQVIRRFPLEVDKFPQNPLPDTHWSISPDEKFLASVQTLGKREFNLPKELKFTLCDAGTGQVLQSWLLDSGAGQMALFSRDSKRVVVCTFKEILVFDVETRNCFFKAALDNQLDVAISADGRWLAAVGLGGDSPFKVRLWDLTTSKELPQVPHDPLIPAGMEFSPDGRYLAISLRTSALFTMEEAKMTFSIRLWDTQRQAWDRTLPITNSKMLVGNMAWSPDGRLLVGNVGKNIRLWEVASGQQCGEWRGHEETITSLAFSPDGRTVASFSSEAPVYLWDVRGRFVPPLAAGALEQAWNDLRGSDAKRAVIAIKRLAATPKLAVPFLDGKLQPVTGVTEAQIRQWITQLGSPQFAVREKAVADLQQVAEQMLPLLQRALQERLSTEARRRLEEIVKQAENTPGELLRLRRAVHVLEWIGTPEVLPILDRLAGGMPEVELTREAKASAGRLRAQVKAP